MFLKNVLKNNISKTIPNLKEDLKMLSLNFKPLVQFQSFNYFPNMQYHTFNTFNTIKTKSNKSPYNDISNVSSEKFKNAFANTFLKTQSFSFSDKTTVNEEQDFKTAVREEENNEAKKEENKEQETTSSSESSSSSSSSESENDVEDKKIKQKFNNLKDLYQDQASKLEFTKVKYLELIEVYNKKKEEAVNIKLRAAKEIAAGKDYAISKYAKDILDVSDNFTRALDSISQIQFDKSSEEDKMKTYNDFAEGKEYFIISYL